jgi:transcriptional regulator with XRE-family HTH domain
MDRSNLSRIEGGHQNYTLATYAQLAEAVGCDFDVWMRLIPKQK